MFDIVIPLFNKEQFVGAAIESVLRQTYDQWRLFVVDDGSTDNGPTVVETYADPRIQLLRQANRGVSEARNTGIRAGTAPWVAFLDADDLWFEDHLEELDRIRRSFPEAMLIGSAFVRMDATQKLPTRPANHGQIRTVSYFREAAKYHELLCTITAAVPRSAFGRVGFFSRISGGEDVELWARLALHGSVAVSSRVTAIYRTGIGGLSTQDSSAELETGGAKLEEVSATIPTLLQELPGIADSALRDDVHAYIDSRISLALGAAVRDGRFSYARELLPLYRNRPRGRARVFALIASLPRPMGQALLGLLRTLRSVRR